MSDREWESTVIEIDTGITAPGGNKQTNLTVMDRLIKEPSHEDFVAVWREEVIGKGLTFTFFTDPLKWLVLFQDDAHGGMCFTHLCRTFSKSWRHFQK
jgi:hypothetical protein